MQRISVTLQVDADTPDAAVAVVSKALPAADRLASIGIMSTAVAYDPEVPVGPGSDPATGVSIPETPDGMTVTQLLTAAVSRIRITQISAKNGTVMRDLDQSIEHIEDAHSRFVSGLWEQEGNQPRMIDPEQ